MSSYIKNPTESAAIRNIERERRMAERREAAAARKAAEAKPAQAPAAPAHPRSTTGQPVYRRVVFNQAGQVVSSSYVTLREKRNAS